VSRHYQKIPEAPFADAIFYFQYRVFYAIFYIMVDERMKHISIIIPLFLIVLIGISGCGVVGGYCGREQFSVENNSSGEGSITEALELKILSRSMGYALGSPFDMEMRLTNNTDKPLKLKFPDGGAFDFFIYQKSELVYRYSEDEHYPTGLKELELKPGESKEFGGVWPCKDRQGKWVRGGRYQLIGIINATPPIISNILMFGLAD